MKCRFSVVLVVLLAFFALAPEARAADGLDGLYWAAAGQDAPAVVRAQAVDGETWLFLPASSELSALKLYFDGETAELSADGGVLAVQSGAAFDLTALFPSAPGDGVYTVEMSRDGRTVSLHIMVSANTASLFLTSDDPVSGGREWIELSKSNRASGQACLLSAGGDVIYAGGMKQIKGRGNTTWTGYPKKPYQIKLSTASDLMENGESAATWVLLANYCDESLIHNRFTFDLAGDLGLAYSPHCRPVDLYYDGEYRGSYLLSEKTETGSSRVEVEDLEKAIEKANPDITDFDSLPLVSGSTPAGNPCQYVSGISLPTDYSGGYLLEMDYEDRAKEEASWFSTSLGMHLAVKSPEYLPGDAMDYISSCWQEFEDALAAGGVNPQTGKSYGDCADVTSLAMVYLLEELSQDPDSFRSSCFFYRDAGDGPIYAGPVWDFDSCYGSDNISPGTTVLQAGQTAMGRLLLAVPSFRGEVQRCWAEKLYPLLTEYVSGQDGHSISAYGVELAASRRMDAVLWPEAAPADYGAALDDFRSFVSQRAQWLDKTMSSWTADTVFPLGFADVAAGSWYGDAVSYVTERGLFSGASEALFAPQGTMSRAMTVTVLYRLAGTPAPGGPAGFRDVSSSAWYSDAVAWAVSAGLVTGSGDGSFRPDEPVTRQELVTMLRRFARTQGADMRTSRIPAAFTDLDGVSAQAKEDFAWAMRHGLILGTSGSTLSPWQSVSRAQAAVIFQRFDLFLGK